jgi:hypothetical protein
MPVSEIVRFGGIAARDRAVMEALRLARLSGGWPSSASWAPLADAASRRSLLAQCGSPAPAEDALTDWLAPFS